MKLIEYMDSKADPLIQIVRTHQQETKSTILQNASNLKEKLQKGTRQIKDIIADVKKERSQGKRMHGKFPNILAEKLVDNEQSYRWIKSGDIKRETESVKVATQDSAISTDYYNNKISKKEIGNKCRLFKQQDKIIDRLTSGCPILEKNEYLMRHDRVGAHLHYSIRKALGIENNSKIVHTHTHTPKPVCGEHEDVTVLWNQEVHTDRKVMANMPGIIINKRGNARIT
jgi:hypothetical protein